MWFGDCACAWTCAIWPFGDAFNIDNGDGDYVKVTKLQNKWKKKNKTKKVSANENENAVH